MHTNANTRNQKQRQRERKYLKTCKEQEALIAMVKEKKKTEIKKNSLVKS